MLQILSNAWLETLRPVRAAEIHMRMKSLYRLRSMNGGSAVPVDLKEWCDDLIVDIVGHRGAMKATSRECDSLLAKWLDKHRIRRSSGEEEGRKEDFMDVMLLIIEDGQISGYDHDTIIKATRLSMILGGTDTTSIILARAIALVLTNPQALKKAQEELDIQVGN
ncbi:hypothetical protein AAC387_Pa04g2217 [Persea americana]